MIKEIKIPEIGENVTSGQVVDVLVKKGEIVEVDQGIVELETDKAVVEIPSPDKGKITELMVKAGDTVDIGAVIARIDTEASADTTEEKRDEPAPEKETIDKQEAEPEKKTLPEKKEDPPEDKSTGSDPVSKEKSTPAPARRSGVPAPASPSVRRLARELGVEVYEIGGSGPGGRITEDDVKNYVRRVVTGKGVEKVTATSAETTTTENLPDFSRWGEIDRQKINKVREITARNMRQAWNSVPHVTQFDKADITELEIFRKKNQKEFEKAGTKLTITAMILKVIVEALKKFPKFNASLDLENGEIIFKKYFHISLAVDTDRGLLVPVIRDADKKSILQLAKELEDLAERARNKKIKPDELEGGTFSISNQGGIGGVDFTPIVFWPQVAILGVSRSAVQPVYYNNEMAARTILPLSLSYDHRIIDGAEAARFLDWVARALENPLSIYIDK